MCVASEGMSESKWLFAGEVVLFAQAQGGAQGRSSAAAAAAVSPLLTMPSYSAKPELPASCIRTGKQSVRSCSISAPKDAVVGSGRPAPCNTGSQRPPRPRRGRVGGPHDTPVPS